MARQRLRHRKKDGIGIGQPSAESAAAVLLALRVDGRVSAQSEVKATLRPAIVKQERTQASDQRARSASLPVEATPSKTQVKAETQRSPTLDHRECPVCGRRFKEKYTMQVHMRVHNEERPFTCPTCGKRFSQRGNLTVHQRTHTQDRPHKCQVCDKTFREKAALKKHSQVHSGQRPFRCTICSRSFLMRGHLKTHWRTHTGEKPFQCKACNRRFSVRASLRRHQQANKCSGDTDLACTLA